MERWLEVAELEETTRDRYEDLSWLPLASTRRPPWWTWDSVASADGRAVPAAAFWSAFHCCGVELAHVRLHLGSGQVPGCSGRLPGLLFLPTPQNTGPAVIPATWSQPDRALTGQRAAGAGQDDELDVLACRLVCCQSLDLDDGEWGDDELGERAVEATWASSRHGQ